MRKDKKKRIRMLYELENLAYKEKPTKQELKRIDEIREELGVGREVIVPEKTFDLNEYLRLLEKMPNATDQERARIMGISKNQLCRGKRKNNLIGKVG